MTRKEEIEFCKKRILEQEEYIKDTALKNMTFGRRQELISSAIGVKKRFHRRLIKLTNVATFMQWIKLLTPGSYHETAESKNR